MVSVPCQMVLQPGRKDKFVQIALDKTGRFLISVHPGKGGNTPRFSYLLQIVAFAVCTLHGWNFLHHHFPNNIRSHCDQGRRDLPPHPYLIFVKYPWVDQLDPAPLIHILISRLLGDEEQNWILSCRGEAVQNRRKLESCRFKHLGVPKVQLPGNKFCGRPFYPAIHCNTKCSMQVGSGYCREILQVGPVE